MKINKLKIQLIAASAFCFIYIASQTNASDSTDKNDVDAKAHNKIIMKAKIRSYEETDPSGKKKKELNSECNSGWDIEADIKGTLPLKKMVDECGKKIGDCS